MLLLTDPLFLKHDTGADHPESSERLTTICDRLERTSFCGSIIRKTPTRPDLQLLTPVHPADYLLRLEEAALSGRSYLHHPDNQLCYESYEAALLAAGAGITVVDLCEETGDTGFCCIRPPGHHAERAMPLGFCFLNNAAIAARYWQSRHNRRRIVIFDFDAHHGNGIQACFEEDPEVLYISIHEHPTFSFPGTGYADDTGSGRGVGATLNLPLTPGSDDGVVIPLLERKITPAIRQFQPEAIIVSAGFDGHRLDDMSGLSYSTGLFTYFGKEIAEWGRQFCHGRVVSLLEGGYHLPSLAESAAAFLEPLAGIK